MDCSDFDCSLINSSLFEDSDSYEDYEQDEFVVLVPNITDMLNPWKYNSEFGLIVTTHAFTFLCGIVGNIFVITMMTSGRDRASRSTTSLFLVSLAVSDLILLLFCTPLQTVEYFANHWIKGGYVCKIQSYVETLSATASVLNLTVVSLERYIVIVHPIRSRTYCTRRNCRFALFIVWGFSLLLAGPAVFIRDIYSYEYRDKSNRTLEVYTCMDYEKHNRLVVDTSSTNLSLIGQYLPPGVYDLVYIVNIYKYLGKHELLEDLHLEDRISAPIFDAKLMLAIYQLLIMFVLPLILMGACYTKVIQELWLSTKQITALTRCYSISYSRDLEPNGSAVCRSKSRCSLGPNSSLSSGISFGSDKSRRSKAKASLSLSVRSSDNLLRTSDTKNGNRSCRPSQKSGYNARSARKQVIKMLILVIALFLLCWGPRLIFNVIVKSGLEAYTKTVYYLRVTVYLLPFIHSCLNPVIYTLMSSNFRRVMLRTCRRRKRASPCSSLYAVPPPPVVNQLAQTQEVLSTISLVQATVETSLSNTSPNNHILNTLSNLEEDDEGIV
ncbi:galanin receptor 2b-like isoform X2 [Artemia franciscana]|uniref:G-protein coupled receptors family 1 profile domain-containing protein n=3 Tax=Artemia franciscana TaxID=6661 RepID=A0AA88HZP8_ARTSF|nr:hypothetical protein QYM36_006054 [Artemia franciscana]